MFPGLPPSFLRVVSFASSSSFRFIFSINMVCVSKVFFCFVLKLVCHSCSVSCGAHFHLFVVYSSGFIVEHTVVFSYLRSWYVGTSVVNRLIYLRLLWLSLSHADCDLIRTRYGFCLGL